MKHKKPKVFTKSNCDECGRLERTRSLRRYKGRYLCYICFSKNAEMIMNWGTKNQPHINLDKSLEKEYLLKGYATSHHTRLLFLPSILIGHKIILIPLEGTPEQMSDSYFTDIKKKPRIINGFLDEYKSRNGKVYYSVRTHNFSVPRRFDGMKIRIGLADKEAKAVNKNKTNKINKLNKVKRRK